MNLDRIKIKAKLTLYSSENGGRISGIKTSYRPNHVFEYRKNSSDFVAAYAGQFEFDKDLILPGETGYVRVLFYKDQNIIKYLRKGRIWWIHEGARKIGEAEILEII